MKPEQEVNELYKRQVFYGSSMMIRLNAVNGLFYYKLYAWIDQGTNDIEVLMRQGKYEGQVPSVLFQEVLDELNLKKIKCGKLVKKREVATQ